MKKQIKLSKTQSFVMHVLKCGGRIFSFEDGDIALEDIDGNTISFYKSTFKWLLKMEFIEVAERPSINCEIYWLSSHFE